MRIEVLDDKELVPKRSMTEAYKSIPDRVYTKRFIPLTPQTLWNLQFEDWEDFEIILREGISEEAGRQFAFRIEDGLELEKAVREGRIKRKAETMVYWGFPPTLTIRADLHSSSSVMIYGPSHDISFMGINDVTREFEFVFNIHMEEGFPVDWWWCSKDLEPELFNRRHMKLGYKLKEMPSRFNDVVEAAARSREIMMDIRNERTPQWSGSSYSVCFVFILVGVATPFSNWDALGQTWDGCNAKNIYELPHPLFGYEPWPPMLNTFFALSRRDWLTSLTRMLSGNLLYIQPISKGILEHAKKHHPDEYRRMLLTMSYSLKKEGVPLPAQTMAAIPPKYNPATGEWESIEFKYPPGPRIFYEDLDVTFEEAISGMLFNITHKTKLKEGKITRDHIISIGHGFDTKYLKPEGWFEEEKRKKRARRKVKKIKKIIKIKKGTK
ncbi:MAG: hypothetical protein ACTSR3_09870 [Candidatus Helarchaeota archaeon]